MATELELQMLARLRAHEVLIQNLLRLVFNNDADAIRDFAARQNVCLDTFRLPDLDPAMSKRLPYETQEALARILEGAILHTESKQLNQSSDQPDA
jgi:hypothetical protein